MVRKVPMARSAVPLRQSAWKKKAPKRRGDSGPANAAEKRYMGHVAALGCAVCRRLGWGATPAIVHHQRTGQGWGRAGNYYTVPLCPPHHQHSGYGLHDMGRPEFAAMYGFTEVELVEETRMLLVAYLPPALLESPVA